MYDKNSSFGKKPVPKILIFIGAMIVIALALGAIVMLLWNAILPNVLGVKPLKYWEALGLFVLLKILFGGFGHGPFKGRHRHSRRAHWKDKWMNMSDEEKAKFKEKWKERCQRKG